MNKTWSVSKKHKIECSVQDLWSLIIEPGNLNLVHPFCQSNEIIEWENGNHRDVLVYLNGLTYFREIIKSKKNKGYTLFIGKKRGKKSKVVGKLLISKIKRIYQSLFILIFLALGQKFCHFFHIF
jgi:hypothetical protein